MVQRLLLGWLLCACVVACASIDDTVRKAPDATVGDAAALADARGGGDIGTNCMATSECRSGLQCLEYAEFGNLGCRVRAKQCTLACDPADGGGSFCDKTFVPHVRCVAGCANMNGICALSSF